jgi:hypothetical protein
MVQVDLKCLRPCNRQLVLEPFEYVKVCLAILDFAHRAPLFVKRSDNGVAIGELSSGGVCEMAQEPMLKRRTGIDDLNAVVFGQLFSDW